MRATPAAAHPHLYAIPDRCSNGHPYQPGSFTVAWDACPCTPAPMPGHHVSACLICLARGLQALTNIPDCLYLDFLPGAQASVASSRDVHPEHPGRLGSVAEYQPGGISGPDGAGEVDRVPAAVLIDVLAGQHRGV